MLKRKIYDALVTWKNSSKGTTAMMIDGARRVGKSFIAEQEQRWTEAALTAAKSITLWAEKILSRSF